MASVSVHEAKTHFSRLLREIEKGHEIEITRHSRVVARLVPPVAPKKKPLLGALKGKVKFDLEDGFFDPLPEEELNAWHDGPI
jgi:prevent-host-death family protein